MKRRNKTDLSPDTLRGEGNKENCVYFEQLRFKVVFKSIIMNPFERSASKNSKWVVVLAMFCLMTFASTSADKQGEFLQFYHP